MKKIYPYTNSSLLIACCLVYVTGCSNNSSDTSPNPVTKDILRKLHFSIEGYQETHKQIPSAATYDPTTGQPLLSWRVIILGDMEAENVRKMFKMDQPWDSEQNLASLTISPNLYSSPEQPITNQTPFQVFVGKGTPFEKDLVVRFADIRAADGLANTILIAEAKTQVTWTKPHDIAYAPDQPLPPLGKSRGTGFHAVMADGSVRFFKKDTDEKIIRAMVTWKGGEEVPKEK
ncbi:MAG TPA: DUF1559 domain-containing protein [Gemmataceae bacterium]|jgi:hypothetical protein|nr:DUF1559 domain-containing protein [Gemmataceae bacterium]